MIDHVTIPVRDLAASRLFYERAFAPLGWMVSFGEEGAFWAFDIGQGLFEFYQEKREFLPVHVAFRVKSHEQVRAFHEAALNAGARDNGAAGPRPQYSAAYFAAFVLDPDGHNIEAMVDP